MKLPLLVAIMAGRMIAQDATELGADVFRQSCAVGYCHGSGGTQGRAPKMIGRHFEPDYVMKVTRDGIPNTGMPGWKDRLSPRELNAVVEYVIRISGSSGTVSAAAANASAEVTPMPEAARRGKDLFFSADHGTRCGTCHALEGIGAAVGPNLAALPASHDFNVRRDRAVSVRRARFNGDEFPALIVEEKGGFVQVYDLTVPPPVLRTLPANGVRWSAEREWNHARATANYTGDEVRSVVEYLRWLARR